MSGPAAERIVVWLVEDHRTLAVEVAHALEVSGDIVCPKVFASAEELLSVSGALAPDLILMDLQLPGMSGLAAIRHALERWPSTAIVALTIHDADDWILGAICAGAVGYLWKPVSGEELRVAVRTAVSGGSPMHASIARKAIALIRASRDEKAKPRLTARELEVLQLLVDGKTQGQIARALGISGHTVDSHVRHIYAALETSSRAAAVVRAVRDRLV